MVGDAGLDVRAEGAGGCRDGEEWEWGVSREGEEGEEGGRIEGLVVVGGGGERAGPCC